MAASYIAENVAMAASAPSAFVIENLATLGIIAGIALLVVAIYETREALESRFAIIDALPTIDTDVPASQRADMDPHVTLALAGVCGWLLASVADLAGRPASEVWERVLLAVAASDT
ncbi:MAG: hypothetical protein ACYCUG_06115 [Acidimicrobiales bacterium]